MSATTGVLSLVNSILSYNYNKLGFVYLTMLELAEQVVPHMRVWRPWATAANYVMRMAPIIYWAFQAQPFLLTEGSLGSNPGHEKDPQILKPIPSPSFPFHHSSNKSDFNLTDYSFYESEGDSEHSKQYYENK
ncbi:hypothetical protein DSO57_1006019 [Entomophthora muscae]|uniref:Uncharacterized protein n=1 Tax=Entomophthora muscae TaxID=34485 RepID=A0ACC2T7S2_9FUNG|nr:hypothetical protein DSO57_1006019 [Entomophthora muscae]